MTGFNFFTNAVLAAAVNAVAIYLIVKGAKEKALDSIHVLCSVSVAATALTMTFAVFQSYGLPFIVNAIVALLYVGAYDQDKKGAHRLFALILFTLHTLLLVVNISAYYLRPL